MKFLFLFLLYLSQSNARDRCTPEISTQISLYGGSSSVQWTSSCRESAQNLSESLNYQTYNPECVSSHDDPMGPKPINYPSPEIPEDCDRIVWQQLRIVESVQYIVDLDLNFCHHFCPDWMRNGEIEIDSDSEENFEGCLRNSSENERVYYHHERGDNEYSLKSTIKKDQRIPWNFREKSQYLIEFLRESRSNSNRRKHCQEDKSRNNQGLDSPTFVSFVYNFGLGAFLAPSLDDLACGDSAPGQILNITDILSEVSSLNPGDLLFLSRNERLSRVFLWTGIIATEDSGIYGIDTILSNYITSRRATAQQEAEKIRSRNDPIYIIADSSNNGPNYRLFLGDYVRDFAFARRIIGREGSFIGRSCEGLGEETVARVENKGYVWGKRKEECQGNGGNDVNVTVQVFVNNGQKKTNGGIFLGK